MNHPPLSAIAFVALLAIATGFTVKSIGEMPEQLAVHFGTNGAPDGWASREVYRISILLLLVILPLLLVWLMAGLPRLTNGMGQIPNAEYWFSPARRQATLRFLTSHSCWLGSMTVAVVYGIHIAIMRANAAAPPGLSMGRFSALLIAYLCGLAWWFAALLRHFGRTSKDNG